MNIDDIVEDIKKLEQADASWNNVERLSWLYTVYDHLNKKDQAKEPAPVIPRVETIKKEVAVPVEVIPKNGEGRFMKAAGGKDITSVMKIVNELMEATEVLNPKLYEVILARIGEI